LFDGRKVTKKGSAGAVRGRIEFESMGKCDSLPWEGKGLFLRHTDIPKVGLHKNTLF
jgi:hypothetical protein